MSTLRFAIYSIAALTLAALVGSGIGYISAKGIGL
jgi:hypothetical protein